MDYNMISLAIFKQNKNITSPEEGISDMFNKVFCLFNLTFLFV